MKIKHIKTTLVLIILLLMIMIPFINFSAYRIKNYISKFEEVNQYIIENKLASKNTLSLITNKRTPDFPILDEAIHKSKLYSINYYTNKGIVYMFKHKNTKATHASVLQHGSLLVMKGVTQTHWLHRLPPTKKINLPRINLTFRTVTKS